MSATVPLAERLRPTTLDEVAGQEDLLGPGKPLRNLFQSKKLHSMVLWGPPGTGKTTLARLLTARSDAHFQTMSAVTSGVKDIRSAIEDARNVQAQGGRFVLFVDEVHPFNKAQQDGFLPHIEDGTIQFIGATTENPSFNLNRALLSRLRVYVLTALSETHLLQLLTRATQVADIELDDDVRLSIAGAAAGDGRQALTVLEIAHTLAGKDHQITLEHVRQATGRRSIVADRQGDGFYDLISAFHKSVRGSNPDATLYWLARMLEGGIEPDYVARRMLRIASEDIGNADPRALTIAGDAWAAWRRLGSPEGELALAHAATFLACAAKSNAVYSAWGQASHLAKETGDAPVPEHLRNAPTALAKQLGHGKMYRYDHDEDGFAAGQTYFPPSIGETIFYQPVNRGLESRIGQKLDEIRRLAVDKKP